MRKEAYALLDDGSDRHVVDSRFRTELGIRTEVVPVGVSVLDSFSEGDRHVGDVDIEGVNGFCLRLSSAIFGSIMSTGVDIPPGAADIVGVDHLQGIEFERFPTLSSEAEVRIGVIVGSEHAWTWMLGERRSGDHSLPIGVATEFGWALIGPRGPGGSGAAPSVFHCHHISARAADGCEEIRRNYERICLGFFREVYVDKGDAGVFRVALTAASKQGGFCLVDWRSGHPQALVDEGADADAGHACGGDEVVTFDEGADGHEADGLVLLLYFCFAVGCWLFFMLDGCLSGRMGFIVSIVAGVFFVRGDDAMVDDEKPFKGLEPESRLNRGSEVSPAYWGCICRRGSVGAADVGDQPVPPPVPEQQQQLGAADVGSQPVPSLVTSVPSRVLGQQYQQQQLPIAVPLHGTAQRRQLLTVVPLHGLTRQRQHQQQHQHRQPAVPHSGTAQQQRRLPLRRRQPPHLQQQQRQRRRRQLWLRQQQWKQQHHWQQLQMQQQQHHVRQQQQHWQQLQDHLLQLQQQLQQQQQQQLQQQQQ